MAGDEEHDDLEHGFMKITFYLEDLPEGVTPEDIYREASKHADKLIVFPPGLRHEEVVQLPDTEKITYKNGMSLYQAMRELPNWEKGTLPKEVPERIRKSRAYFAKILYTHMLIEGVGIYAQNSKKRVKIRFELEDCKEKSKE